MADSGLEIEQRGDVYFLSGELSEFSDLSPLKAGAEPLHLNMKGVTRINSIGIRNLLKFLNEWGTKAFVYHECPSEFIDQLNMIPALMGPAKQGRVEDLFVPFECDACGHEQEFFGKTSEFDKENATRPCPKCGQDMLVVSDSFFVFVGR